MKLLVACSSLDLQAPLSATPAWWQLLKGLYEVGADLIVTAYHGQVPESLWWHAYPNPARFEGELYSITQNAFRKIVPRSVHDREENEEQNFRHTMISRLAQTVVAPRWQRHLARIIRAEPDIDAALFICLPANHLRGVANSIRQQFKIPILFYDGDVPASFPNFQGFATGFRIYQGADLAEFDAVLSPSKGGAETLSLMGARAVNVLYYAADPQIYQPLLLPQDIDILFYGTTAEYRAEQLRAMIALPSQALPGVRFVVRGRSLGDLGRAEVLPFFPFSNLQKYISRSKINLVITRQPHAGTYGSSSMRPFELAMMGACMVCSPYHGIEEWFEPEREVIVVGSTEEAIDRYRFLLTHDDERRVIGEAARRRALAEHTFQHRARQLVEIVRKYL